MKSGTVLLLQGIVVLTGLGMLGLMLWEPRLEGRNAHATVFEIYFKDPFLAYVYVGSLPFFVALHRAFGMLAQLGRDHAFSHATVHGLRVIKRCALTLIGFVAGAIVFILVFGEGEDRPAGIFMSLLATLAAGTVATVAAMFERSLRRTLQRSEG